MRAVAEKHQPARHRADRVEYQPFASTPTLAIHNKTVEIA